MTLIVVYKKNCLSKLKFRFFKRKLQMGIPGNTTIVDKIDIYRVFPWTSCIYCCKAVHMTKCRNRRIMASQTHTKFKTFFFRKLENSLRNNHSFRILPISIFFKFFFNYFNDYFFNYYYYYV